MQFLNDTRVGSALKDAGLAALVTLGLTWILVGLRTRTDTGGLIIDGEWTLVAAMVVVVAIGRFLMSLLVWRGENPVANAAKTVLPSSDTLTKVGTFIGPALLALAVDHADVGRPLHDRPRHSGPHLRDARLGSQHRGRLAGLLDLGYVAFYAVGAYSYALLAHYFDLSFWVCLPLAGILAAFWGIILGFPVLRLRGDYLAIVTLAFGKSSALSCSTGMSSQVDRTASPRFRAHPSSVLNSNARMALPISSTSTIPHCTG